MFPSFLSGTQVCRYKLFNLLAVMSHPEFHIEGAQIRRSLKKRRTYLIHATISRRAAFSACLRLNYYFVFSSWQKFAFFALVDIKVRLLCLFQKKFSANIIVLPHISKVCAYRVGKM